MRRFSDHWLHALLVTTYAISVALASYTATRNAAWNFDVVGYTAVALSRQGVAPSTLHRRAYAALEAVAPADAYVELTQSSEYRRRVHASPDAFTAELPLYTNKLAYVFLVGAIATTDADVVRATHLISGCAYFLLSILVFIWAVRCAPFVRASAIAFGLMLSPPFLESARLSTPDATCALTLCLGAFLVVEFGHRAWAALPLATACLVRPDAFFFAVPILLLALSRDSSPRDSRKPRIAGCLLVGAASAVAAGSGYSWGVVMSHTFVKKILYSGDAMRSIRPLEYTNCLIANITGSGTLGFSLLSLGVLLTAVAWKGSDEPVSRRLLLVAWTSILVHYLAFPSISDRFFLSSYVFIAIACARAIPSAASRALPQS